MKKETLADKLARKSFESPQFQQSWQVHRGAFGPILDPAFGDNYQARIHLCAALNHISKRQLSQGLAKLKLLEKHLETDQDKCAYLFFLGLYCELAGNQEQMLAMYTMANEYGHKFYMPYLKLAKFYLNGHLYERAEENLRCAIDCFSGTGLSPQDKMILGSAYSNLASCLLMTHRYEDARSALDTSASLCPDASGREAVEVMLHALNQDRTRMDACLETLKVHAPAAYPGIRDSAERILDKTDPLFFPQPIGEDAIPGFWQWFSGYEATLRTLLDRQDYEQALTPVAEKLLETFPFLEETPNVALGKNEQGWVIRLQDLYAVAVMDAYKQLLTDCPEKISAAWQFDIAHE